jgi:hypothetical protein
VVVLGNAVATKAALLSVARRNAKIRAEHMNAKLIAGKCNESQRRVIALNDRLGGS